MEKKHIIAEADLLPVPTTITRNTGTPAISEDEFLATAPLAKVKEFFEKKYEGQGPF